MNRVLLSLLIVFIALAGIACVSASSDFNGTVDCDYMVSDVNETVVEDEIIDDDSFEPIDNSSELIENDTEIVIDNSSELIENDTEIVIDNSSENIDGNNEIVVDKPYWDKWELWNDNEVPDVDVSPTIVDSGDKILDAALYYADYYRAYKNAYGFDLSDPTNMIRSLDAVFDLVYKTHDIGESISIVAKLYCIAELKYYGCEPFVKDLLESSMYSVINERFHMRYFDPNEYYYEPTRHDSDPKHPLF